MTQNITYLIKRIKSDIVNYINLHDILLTPEMIEAAVQEVISMAGITIGEDTYFRQDVIDAINVVREGENNE